MKPSPIPNIGEPKTRPQDRGYSSRPGKSEQCFYMEKAYHEVLSTKY